MKNIALLVVPLLLLTACNADTQRHTVSEVQADTQEPVPQLTMLKATGLYLTDNPLESPPGGLSLAEDAVIRRGNVLEPRRGNAPDVMLSSPARSLTTYRGAVIGNDLVGGLFRRESASSAVYYSGSFVPPAGSYRARFMEAKNNLYLTTGNGVFRLDSLGGTPALSGVPAGLEGTYAFAGSAGFLVSPASVAYRFVWGRRDANGNLLLGAPSGRLLVTYSTYASGTVTLSGGAGNVTVVVGGTSVGPVAFNSTDAQTALDAIAAINANGTVAALVTASSGGSGIITITAKAAGSAGDGISLAATRSAGSVSVSDAVLTGGTSSRDVTVTERIPEGIVAGTDFLQIYRTETRALSEGDPGEEMAQVAEVFPTAAQIAAGTLDYTDVASVTNGPTAYFAPSQGGIINSKDRPPVAKDMAVFKGHTFYAVKSAVQRVQLTLLAVGGSQGLSIYDGISITDSDTETRYVGAASESPGDRLFRVYTDGTASQNIEATARSLVRVINADDTGPMYAAYASGANDPPGIIQLSARSLSSGAFTIRALMRSGVWSPALRAVYSASRLERSANVVTATIDSNSTLHVGDILDLAELDPPDAGFPSGLKTISAIPVPGGSTFQYAESGPDVVNDSAEITFSTNVADVTTSDGVQTNTWALSSFEEPEAVPTSNYFTVGGETSTLYRIVAQGDGLWFFCSDGIYRLSGDDETNFTLRPFDLTAKIIGPDTAVALENRVWALTSLGVVAVSDTGVEVVSHIPGRTSIRKPLQEVEALFREEGASNVLEAYAFAMAYETEHEYRLWLPSGPGVTSASYAYVFATQQGAWTRHNVPALHATIMPLENRQYLGVPLSPPSSAMLKRERKAMVASDLQDSTGVGIPFRVAYTVLTGDNAGALKQWQQVTWHMESPPPASLGISLSTEVATTPSTGTMPTGGLTYVRSFVPVEQSYSSTLTVGASHSTAAEKCSLLGISVTYTTTSDALSSM